MIEAEGLTLAAIEKVVQIKVQLKIFERVDMEKYEKWQSFKIFRLTCCNLFGRFLFEELDMDKPLAAVKRGGGFVPKIRV